MIADRHNFNSSVNSQPAPAWVNSWHLWKSLSRGDRSRAASFGARCGGAGMAGIGPIRNSSSIQTTVIQKLFLRSSAGSQVDFTRHIPADHRFLEDVQSRRNAGGCWK